MSEINLSVFVYKFEGSRPIFSNILHWFEKWKFSLKIFNRLVLQNLGGMQVILSSLRLEGVETLKYCCVCQPPFRKI